MAPQSKKFDVLDIFCDESGFTGQNLLNPDQRFFAYGSVAISPTEAAELVTQTIRDFRVQGHELKGKNLLRHPSGRKAAIALIRQLGERSRVVLVNKQYALAGKLFEYTFEPLLSDISTALYGVSFQKFIANLVYVCSLAGHGRARDFADRFEKGVRGEEESLKSFLSLHSPNSGDDPIEALISFCVFHRDAILRELREAKGAVPWLLDITGSSLNSLLTDWGRRADQLRVVCDESGPLASAASYFDVWIGREDKRSFASAVVGSTLDSISSVRSRFRSRTIRRAFNSLTCYRQLLCQRFPTRVKIGQKNWPRSCSGRERSTLIAFFQRAIGWTWISRNPALTCSFFWNWWLGQKEVRV